jgi:hypothetical protein
MTPRQFATLVERHFAGERGGDEGQNAFARWLPADPRTVRRWIAEGPPVAVARLLKLIDEHKISAANVPEA